jgi:hypothetical protein
MRRAELLIQSVFRHRQAMVRIGRRLELLYLLAAQPQLSPEPLDPAQSRPIALVGQFRL